MNPEDINMISTTEQSGPPSGMRDTEDTAAQALAHFYSDDLKYCPELGRWYAWNGHRWEQQNRDGGTAWTRHLDLARALPADDNSARTHKRRMLSVSGTAAVLRHARNDPKFIVHLDELDAHPWELNTPSGIIDLRDGTLLPPDPHRFHTRSTSATVDTTADLTEWLEFLGTTFQGDLEMIGYLHRLLGYACVGEVRESVLPVFYGPSGANGKTVLLETVAGVLGDYATSVQAGFLLAGVREHPTEIARLSGVRFAVASETNDGARFDEARVKLLTGGDRLTARFMRQDEFTFVPSHTLVLMTNHRPEVTAGGPAFWRRVREIPFNHQVPEVERDEDLRHRLVDEHGAAIMAWLASGAAEYHQHGLMTPSSVKVATADYEQSTDSIAGFVDDCVHIGGGEHLKTKISVFRDAYETYCSDMGHSPVTSKALSLGLQARYSIGSSKSGSNRFYTNCTLMIGDGTERAG